MAVPRNRTLALVSFCVILGFFLIPEKGRSNPTGGNVVAGSATLTGEGSNSLQVNQSSNAAIINWKTFSINNGQSTSFIQPGSQSAVLNRVLGGSTSQINGTLNANGRVFLLNQNGVIIGRTGVVNAEGGFTASTQNMTDANFLKGKLRFSGHSLHGVMNMGEITSSLGDVILIGNSVTNSGTLQAGKGTVGLVAGNNVLLAQKNSDGSTITVSPGSLKTTTSQTGVLNSGTINAAAAELKAADGNIYAVAIENSGTVRATTVKHQGGHIWLSSNSGTISNSGILDASASAVGERGGTIVLKSPGTVSHTGTILAKGGTGGVGGKVDILSGSLVFSGTVDLSSQFGKSGTLLLDPATLNVVTGGGSDFTQSTIDPNAVDAALNSSNLTLNADNSITISNEINWTSGNTLTLSTNNSGASISINAPIIGINGGLAINTAGAIVPSTSGSVNVGAFILQNGFWNQNAGGGTLAGFTANTDFELQNNSTFFRVEAGDGSPVSPYQIVDVYGLQGIASPSNSLLASNFIQTQNINASNTATWNSVGGGSYVGFIPIGNATNFFSGNYNGQNYTITGLTINQPSANFMGLFGYTGNNVALQGHKH